MSQDDDKRIAADAAAALVADGMRVGLGTGSTVAHLLPALAARNLDIRCVATSVQTEEAARALGLAFDDATDVDRLDIAIDGADQIAPDFWLVKGGGGAHTREKVVAAMADRFVVIADASKLVQRLRPPVPLELSRYGLTGTLRRLVHVELRDAPPSPDGGLIADYVGALGGPESLNAWLSDTPGVIDHGLFAPSLVDDVLIGRNGTVDHLQRLI